MTRDEMVSILVAGDIISIEKNMIHKDYSYIWSVLTGDGFTQYIDMSDEELVSELQERETDDSVLEFASFLRS